MVIKIKHDCWSLSSDLCQNIDFLSMWGKVAVCTKRILPVKNLAGIFNFKKSHKKKKNSDWFISRYQKERETAYSFPDFEPWKSPDSKKGFSRNHTQEISPLLLAMHQAVSIKLATMNDIPPFSLILYIAFHRLFCYCFGWSSSFSCQIVFWVNYIIGFTFVFSSCYSFVPVCETCHQKSISAISYSEKLFLVPNLSVLRELVRKCQKKKKHESFLLIWN